MVHPASLYDVRDGTRALLSGKGCAGSGDSGSGAEGVIRRALGWVGAQAFAWKRPGKI